jgi:hypothetical protein
MDIYERLYEAGMMYQRVRPEKRETALRSIEIAEGALRDLEGRVGTLVSWLERHQVEEAHGGSTRPS